MRKEAQERQWGVGFDALMGSDIVHGLGELKKASLSSSRRRWSMVLRCVHNCVFREKAGFI